MGPSVYRQKIEFICVIQMLMLSSLRLSLCVCVCGSCSVRGEDWPLGCWGGGVFGGGGAG